jgi:hypothetical protein
VRRALDRHPAYAALFVAVLVLPQLLAMVGQVRAGYRPFVHAPVRVALSWDMFAVNIERCRMTFDPPLPPEAGRVARFRPVRQTLEWDPIPVFDSVGTYRRVAKRACRDAAPETQVHLRCFLPGARELRDDHPCQ